MEINAITLGSLNDNVSLAFNTQFDAAPSRYGRFTLEVPSTGHAETYPRLDLLGGMREWVGDRAVQSLSQSAFTIVNKDFEQTISVSRNNLADDKYGMLAIASTRMGKNAKELPDLLVAALMKAGHTTLCYDGQNFFDTAHPSFDAAGAATTVANFATDGSGTPPWYLIDTKQIVMPLIYQLREPFKVIPKFSPTDQQVFWNKEYEWGADGRCNVGFGLWQVAFMSTQAITHDNIKANIILMESLRRPSGAPMGISPNLLVTGSTNYFIANALAQNEFQPTSLSATALVPNLIRGTFEAMKDEWLN